MMSIKHLLFKGRDRHVTEVAGGAHTGQEGGVQSLEDTPAHWGGRGGWMTRMACHLGGGTGLSQGPGPVIGA